MVLQRVDIQQKYIDLETRVDIETRVDLETRRNCTFFVHDNKRQKALKYGSEI